MKVTVNGQSYDVRAETLDSLLCELAFEGSWLATAVNNTLVRRADRPDCRLSDGDRVEILSPMQGG